jgi:hypothetical protein
MSQEKLPSKAIEPNRALLHRYVLNRTTIGAILFSSPAILSAFGSFAMSMWIDQGIASLTQRRDALSSRSSQLEGFKENVERFQLDRGAMLLLLTGVNADASLKYALDKLFRLNAQDSMRRVAALLYPTEWKAKMLPYEAITGTDYADRQTIGDLQSMEDAMIQDAAQRLVTIQEELNALSAEIDRQTAFRTAVLSVGNSIMYIVTIILFFARTAKGSNDG